MLLWPVGLLPTDLPLGLTLRLGLLLGVILILLLWVKRLGLMLRLLDFLGLLSTTGTELSAVLLYIGSVMPLLGISPFLLDDLASTPTGLSIIAFWP